MLGQLARKRMRNAEFLELAVEPVRKLRILMAVAQECIVSGMGPDDVMDLGGRRAGRAVISRHSGMLGHSTTPIKPATLVNTMR